jgi:hypothetical protein
VTVVGIRGYMCTRMRSVLFDNNTVSFGRNRNREIDLHARKSNALWPLELYMCYVLYYVTTNILCTCGSNKYQYDHMHKSAKLVSRPSRTVMNKHTRVRVPNTKSSLSRYKPRKVCFFFSTSLGIKYPPIERAT